MMGDRVVLLVAVLALTAGCAPPSNENEDESPQESSQHVWSGQVQTQEKAKGVEQTLMQSAQRQDQHVEQSSQ